MFFIIIKILFRIILLDFIWIYTFILFVTLLDSNSPIFLDIILSMAATMNVFWFNSFTEWFTVPIISLIDKLLIR